MNEQIFHEEWEAWKTLGFSLIRLSPICFRGNILFEKENVAFEVTYPDAYPFLTPDVKCITYQNRPHQAPISQSLCLWEGWKDYPRISAHEIYNRLLGWLHGQKYGFLPEEEHSEPMYHSVHSTVSAALLCPQSLIDNWKENESEFQVSLNISSNLGVIQGFLNQIGEGEKIENENFLDYAVYGIAFNISQPPPAFESFSQYITWLTEQGFQNVEEKMMKAHRRVQNHWINLPMIGIRHPEGFLLLSDPQRITKFKSTWKKVKFIFFRTEFLSEERLFKRIPDLRPLKSKSVLLIGAGSIGSTIALELTKAGIGNLDIMDPDTVSFGNLIRHTEGVESIGANKAFALKKHLQSHNPYLNISAYNQYFGDETLESSLMKILLHSDAIVCAVGHSPTERYVDHLARRHGIPVIYAYASAGAASGRIFRVIPEKTGCYHCHMYGIEDGTFPPLVHAENIEEIHDEQSCGAPAYPGSGIDTGTIALFAARLTLQTLLVEFPEAYPPTDKNHFVWMRKDWSVSSFIVEPKKDCPFCSNQTSSTLDFTVPEAKTLIDAINTYESCLLTKKDTDVALRNFESLAQTFYGKTYTQKNKPFTITRITIEKREREYEYFEELIYFTNEKNKEKKENLRSFFSYHVNNEKIERKYLPKEKALQF